MRNQSTEKQGKQRPPTAQELARLREALQTRYGELLAEIEHLEDGATRAPDGSVAERQADEGAVVDTQEDDFEVLAHADELLRDIARALQRMDEGRYGRCDECDAWLAIERLEALPHSDLCIVCAAAEEQHVEVSLES